jgi:predicted CopG family antitoxin
LEPKERKKNLVSEMTKNIKVSDDVHYDLGELGKLSESYNDVIKRLIDHYKKTKGAKQHGSSDHTGS